ncbi:diguanylate cyclase with PAS/PAC sensor [Deinococcus grandis]|uniref:Diguanylate cyclase with PAS/PAC sensor n=1 Tax=Deinococcus grandis TaxID=57498 RepID=A0A124BS36_9DEIO|nr:diguanylate cyclase with PAS/PAC sensor [Deinococcus grandis]
MSSHDASIRPPSPTQPSTDSLLRFRPSTDPVSPVTAEEHVAPRADDRLDVLCQHLLLDTPDAPVVQRPLTWAQTLLPDHRVKITAPDADPHTAGPAEPLTGPGRTTLATLHADGTHLTPAQRQILRGAAQALMDSVTRHVLHDQLAQATTFTAAMTDIHALSADQHTPTETAAAAMHVLHRSMRVDWSGLLHVQDGHLTLVTDAATPRGEHLTALLTRRLAYGEPHTLPTTHTFHDDYTDSDGAIDHLLNAGVRSAAWLPLSNDSDQDRFVLLFTRQDEPAIWTAQEQRLLSAAARSVSIALERDAAMQHLERLAQTDPLTGLGNRRALDETLQTLEGQAFTLGVIDLNGMKRVNDEHGHASGDDLLRTFARHLWHDTVRAFRLGGDEYALIDPEGTPDRLQHLTDHAVRATQAAGFPITAALGTAGVPTDTRSPSRALRLADTRMYAHKRDDDR